jgi:Na+-driven multidrug efflux pump
MLIRSLVIQATLFASLVAASRLGTNSLAAHSIISQLWSIISYLVDGFAAAGIVLGSRLAAHARSPITAPIAKR